jgi:predicted DNA-binding protein YlxM (UPF0122 family)
MELEKVQEINLLFDIYGELLTKKQNRSLELYYEDDLSLSEIAGELGISRQGVYDNIKKGISALKNYEEKLKLLKNHIRSSDIKREIINEIEDMENNQDKGSIIKNIEKNKKQDL